MNLLLLLLLQLHTYFLIPYLTYLHIVEVVVVAEKAARTRSVEGQEALEIDMGR